MTATRRGLIALALSCCALAGCGLGRPAETRTDPSAVFRAVDCNGVTDADITTAVGSTLFTRVVVSDAGCFWQENTAIGTYGLGMGISTWWYRGSDLERERTLERGTERTLVNLSMNGNRGFKAYDDDACSVYVAKGRDVITWSVQTDNPRMLPDLCSIIEPLAKLSQDRVN